MVPGEGKTIEDDFDPGFNKIFAELADQVSAIINNPDFKPARAPAPEGPTVTIDIDRLPATGAKLFGRAKKLVLLDQAWADDGENVVSLVAWGGVGKSTLVNKWLEGLKADNYRGAKRVFGWSFHSQGTGERVTSADQFVDEALRFFGEEDPTRLRSPWAKGERLAELVREEKPLLVLDGMEPLQDPWQGIKDPALQRLVEELAGENPGLCLITTREPARELEDFPDTTSETNLEQISAEAGCALLRVKGVDGTDAELEAASHAFGNHALAINLLASWLRGIEGHHIRHAADIADLDISDDKGQHPRRVMAAFSGRFGDGPEVVSGAKGRAIRWRRSRGRVGAGARWAGRRERRGGRRDGRTTRGRARGRSW